MSFSEDKILTKRSREKAGTKAAAAPPLKLQTPIQYLKGVGPHLASLLQKRGLQTVQDLLRYFPRAYEDRRVARNIGSLQVGELVSLRANLITVSSFQMGKSRRRIYDLLIRDGSGQIHCKYFRVPYKGYFERFQTPCEVRVVGKVISYRGRLEFHHPELVEYDPEEVVTDQLIPIYPEIESISSTKIMKLIRQAFSFLSPEELAADALPTSLREKYNLVSTADALKDVHFPKLDFVADYPKFQSPGQRRFIFQEFFWLELYLAGRRAGIKQETSNPIVEKNNFADQLLKSLPFSLTEGQKNAIHDITEDLKKNTPMHRLVQGDVGSGKTLVAFLCALKVIENNFQVCMMAPTEILAEQHLQNAKKYFTPLGLKVELLSGRTKQKERQEILQGLLSGEIHFVVGTHALIEEDVQFKNLAMVIIDEQHRFGVHQRGRLKSKGLSPHFLVMTATPIPRTLALTVYGDLDISTIRELPAGRSPIQTRVIYEKKRPQALDFMAQQIAKGRQAYVVYPLVEESEKIDLKNAIEEYEKLCAEFPKIKFGLLHGRMKPDEKDNLMQKFREQEIQVLVSTTVIEVGVDVPNANLMIIEHAERFGLSQLHQLRGRVGRGTAKSFCVLILGRAVSEEARLRTQMMEQSSNGFEIAEFDLELRGPGEFLGTRQSGLPGFQMANLIRDAEVLNQARAAAFELFERDPKLKAEENSGLRQELLDNHGPAFLASIA